MSLLSVLIRGVSIRGVQGFQLGAGVQISGVPRFHLALQGMSRGENVKNITF